MINFMMKMCKYTYIDSDTYINLCTYKLELNIILWL